MLFFSCQWKVNLVAIIICTFWITLIHLLVHFDETLKHSETRENLNLLFIEMSSLTYLNNQRANRNEKNNNCTFKVVQVKLISIVLHIYALFNCINPLRLIEAD